MAEVRTRMATFATSFRSTRVATWQPKDLVVHVHQGAVTANMELSCPGNPPAQAYELQALVAGIVKPSDLSTTPVDTFKNRLASEIIKAATSVSQWHTWGSLAFNTEIGTVEDYTDDSGAVAGVMVTFAIYFRTDETNPYNARA
jgi:hypothetical protein